MIKRISKLVGTNNREINPIIQENFGTNILLENNACDPTFEALKLNNLFGV